MLKGSEKIKAAMKVTAASFLLVYLFFSILGGTD